MISVVVPVYNMGNYLGKCISSLLAQTYQDYEILLIDDGSTDGSSEICERQAEGRPCIRVFHKSNGGLSSARNFGIDHAKGEWIIFPDPDDWVEPNYLQGLLFIQNRDHADLSICGHFDSDDDHGDVWWNKNAKPCMFDREEALMLLMQPNSFKGYAWNKLYRMDVINNNNLRFDEELGMVQDLEFAVRYFLCCQTVAYDPIPLYHHNHSSNGVTNFSALTPRKLSAIQTYKKIGSSMQKTHPHISAVAYSSLCKTCTKYIALYYYFNTRDRRIIRMLKKDFSIYKQYFFAGDTYTEYEKRYSHIIPFSPWLYYVIYRMRRSYNQAVARRRNKKHI